MGYNIGIFHIDNGIIVEHSEGYESWDMMISASYDMNNGILYITPMHIYIMGDIYGILWENKGYLWDFTSLTQPLNGDFRAVFVTILMGRKTWRLNHLKSI